MKNMNWSPKSGGFAAQPPEDADDEITSSFRDEIEGTCHYNKVKGASMREQTSSSEESSRKNGTQVNNFEFNYEKSSSIHCDE